MYDADAILLLQFSPLLGLPCRMTPYRDSLDLYIALLNEYDLILPICLALVFQFLGFPLLSTRE
jgi:hypothetical protein